MYGIDLMWASYLSLLQSNKILGNLTIENLFSFIKIGKFKKLTNIHPIQKMLTRNLFTILTYLKFVSVEQKKICTKTATVRYPNLPTLLAIIL